MKTTKQLFACAILLGSILVPRSYASTTGTDPRPSDSADDSRKPAALAADLSLIFLLATGALINYTLRVHRR